MALRKTPNIERLTTAELKDLVGESVQIAYTYADARLAWPKAGIVGEDEDFYCWIGGKVLSEDRIQLLFQGGRFASYLAIEDPKEGDAADRYYIELA